MKISDLYQQSKQVRQSNEAQVSNPLDKPKVAPKDKDQTSPATDTVEISAQSKEIQKINDTLKETPEVRSEKVAALKKQIDEGQYKVDAESVAGKMIQQSILDLLP